MTQRLEMMARMWSSGNFATNNILENITWHFRWHGRNRWWPRAEIVRNHINGYRGGLFTQIDDGASFCCKYSSPMSILTHRQMGGDENDGWIVIGPVSNPDYHSASVSAHLFPLHELRSSGIWPGYGHPCFYHIHMMIFNLWIARQGILGSVFPTSWAGPKRERWRKNTL